MMARRGAMPRGLSLARLFLPLAFILYPLSFLSAETRIKTVEYNFGGYYSASDLSSNTQFNFPTRTVKLPENGKTIKSAWLEFEGLAVSAVNINPAHGTELWAAVQGWNLAIHGEQAWMTLSFM